MYKHLFGPVPSRRLGMSLGVDLVPHKICTMDCVYCECGATTKLTTERKEYILFSKVSEELNDYFSKNPDPDYITFSGAGEPTLNSRIGDVIKYIKKLRPNIKIAVLTNGSLLSDKSVRNEIIEADLVLPSFDANYNTDFQKVNRPASNINLNEYLHGLTDFRKEFKGEIWLEILIIPDYNDSKENIMLLKDAILQINPDKVQLNTLDRPGTSSNLRAATQNELKNIISVWNLPNVEIIASAPKRKDIKAYRVDIEDAIIETISRRPCTLEDISDILGMKVNELNKYLRILEDEQKIKTIKQERGYFYTIK